ncbi:hypothetical protein [Sphingobium yanoikuyae]|uniref:hypothetical protein n=1 Tax=Sphingobium yanoikuyae TaxID=13690 RepID=UPI000AA8B594|nr:hypothetical protein [Sphingobium yanoikuyae]
MSVNRFPGDSEPNSQALTDFRPPYNGRREQEDCYSQHFQNKRLVTIAIDQVTKEIFEAAHSL